ncbi:MAG: SDR family NAD(P)-dependent oxidoreductase, partial [Evtepia sp.]
MRIAILTGASSGLGREYARQITAQDHDIDEVWAIARRKERLDELAAQLPCPVRVLPLDLSKTASLDELKKLLEIERPVVRWLVCAAGFGKISDIADLDPQDALDMVNVNCRAAMGVTNLCLPYLTKGSRILEICSTASFQPLPGLGVYAATKAFLSATPRRSTTSCSSGASTSPPSAPTGSRTRNL